MNKTKKYQIPNNKPWICKCGNKLGVLSTDSNIIIRGPKGQEYEIGFSYIEVTCPRCHKKCTLKSKKFEDTQESLEILKKNNELSKPTIDSGEADLRVDLLNSLGENGLKSFYSLEDRHKKILKAKLTEWQNKIFDCLCDMGLDADISDEEDWNRVIQLIASKLKISNLMVEKNIVKINKKITEIVYND